MKFRRYCALITALGVLGQAPVAGSALAKGPARPLAHPPEKVPDEVTERGALEMTIRAELLQPQAAGGRAGAHLQPADHVVPGDLVIYTVQVRNVSAQPVMQPQFVAPIPEHTSYVPDSAVGPGADISYSVDGGQNFDKPDNLRVHGAGGALRAATASDYTHIRWTLRHRLKPDSVVYARFHARLN
jgi:uncharacterized repeat protein (TIGR01451 family)